MRTTVNIDDHVLAEAKVVAARSHRSLGAVIEDALRFSFAAGTTTGLELGLVELHAHGRSGLQPGIDLADKGQIGALLDDDALSRADP